VDTKLNIEVYPNDDGDPVEFENVDYLSFINGETYGKPPIIAPGTENYSQGPTEVVFAAEVGAAVGPERGS